MFLRKAFSVSVLFFAATFSAAQSQPITVPKVPQGPPQSVVVISSQKGDVTLCQVQISRECWVENKTGSQCVWCSAECLARKHGIESCYDLTARYKGVASPGDLDRVLQERGLVRGRHYYHSPMGAPRDRSFLVNSCANGWGCAVGVGHGNVCHVLNVIHYKDGVVKVIDNSNLSRGVQSWKEDEFLNRWNGWAYTLVPPTKKWF
jgi:hypothetical protein